VVAKTASCEFPPWQQVLSLQVLLHRRHGTERVRTSSMPASAACKASHGRNRDDWDIGIGILFPPGPPCSVCVLAVSDCPLVELYGEQIWLNLLAFKVCIQRHRASVYCVPPSFFTSAAGTQRPRRPRGGGPIHRWMVPSASEMVPNCYLLAHRLHRWLHRPARIQFNTSSAC
jgi:hypothetical protein